MRRRCQYSLFFSVLLLFMGMVVSAAAETAKQITAECVIEGCELEEIPFMMDDDLDTACIVKSDESLTISYPDGIGGVTLTLYSKVDTKKKKYFLPTVNLQIKNDEGKWETIDSWHDHLIEWKAVPEGTTELRIVSSRKGTRFAIPQLHVYGPGEKAPEAPVWEELDKADLMIIVAHPDDELLWFGGMLPTYAGERGLKVQVVYVTSKGGRKLELLKGLWTCGVKYYPQLFELEDKKMKTMQQMRLCWQEGYFTRLLFGSIRKYRPQVVATHDFNGEYGHIAHVLCAEQVAKVVQEAGNPKKSPRTSGQYGAWTVKKLYIHLWPENQIHMDWTKPLSAFDGETSISVATRALDCHVSQVKSDRAWSMDRAADYDNGLFGLYWTTVGPDEAGDDIMEHIELN